MQTASNLTPFVNLVVRPVAYVHSDKIVQQDMNYIIATMWNHGVEEAFEYYCKAVMNGPTEVAVSHRIEALAFPGTNFEILFNLLCNEGRA